VEGAIVVDEAARRAEDETGDECSFCMLARIDEIVRVEDRTLLSEGRHTEQDAENSAPK
jgi:hypothetical protein